MPDKISTAATFAVGDKVSWISSNTHKAGEIVAIVPAGSVPSDVGHPKAGAGGMSRDHTTYIIKGRRLQRTPSGMAPYGSAAVYWPHVSLITPQVSA